jgi:hypothetical protein
MACNASLSLHAHRLLTFSTMRVINASRRSRSLDGGRSPVARSASLSSMLPARSALTMTLPRIDRGLYSGVCHRVPERHGFMPSCGTKLRAAPTWLPVPPCHPAESRRMQRRLLPAAKCHAAAAALLLLQSSCCCCCSPEYCSTFTL